MAKTKKTSRAPEDSAVEADKENIRQEGQNVIVVKEKGKAVKDALKEHARALKEAARQEKELKRLQEDEKKKEREEKKQQEEEQKEEKRKEKETKKQHADAKKEQKRKAREAAEQKQQLAFQKQASIMERFLRRKEPNTPVQNQREDIAGFSPSPQNLSNQSSPWGPNTPASKEVMAHMDLELNDSQEWNFQEIFRSHSAAWRTQRKARASENFQRWGLRRHPKVTVNRELRLQGAGPDSVQKSFAVKNLSFLGTRALKRSRLEFEEDVKLDMDGEGVGSANDEDLIAPPRKKRCNRPWKLLQFDKSHRPAFYGTFSTTSETVGPRCPLRKDPLLEYEVDSDEEWEEEDPGESLSDCEDKEEEMDRVEAEIDEDIADGFVVPDGYLSDTEGVHFEDAGCKEDAEASRLKSSFHAANKSGSPSGFQLPIKEHESQTFQRLTKLLDDVTKHALQRNRPLLVTAFLHRTNDPKASQLPVNRTERLCLQALSMRAIAPDLVIGQPEAVAIKKEVEMETKKGKVKGERSKARRHPFSTLITVP